MKNLFSAAVIALLAVLFITPAFAQKPKSKPDAIKEIAALSTSKNPDAIEKQYQLSKDFLKRFGTDTDDPTVRIKKFVFAYRNDKFLKAVDGSKYAEAYALGKEILADEPDNLDVKINLAYVGYNAASAKGDRSYVDDVVAYAGVSIKAIDAGTAPQTYGPFKNKDEALGWLHYMIGSLVSEKDIKAGVEDVYKATQYESPIKSASVPYYMVASYYETLYAKYSTDLKVKSPRESDYKDVSAATEKAVKLMLDAYARACTRAEAEKSPNAAEWKARFTQIYTFRNKSAAGLAEFMAAAEKTPFADPTKF